MMRLLIELSVRNRWLVMLIAVAVMAAGVLQLRRLPVDVLPDLTRPTVTVLTEAPGLAPEEVESLVSIPIEQALLGVAGMERIRSVNEVGLSQVIVEFGWSADLTDARARVLERLAAARDRLPESIRPGLTPATSLLGNILLVAVVDTHGGRSPAELRELAETRIVPRLQALPGMAEVVAQGGGLRELRIEPDPERLLAHGITVDDLRQAAAGIVHTATGGLLEGGTREILIRPRSITMDPSVLGATPVRVLPERVITLAEVARLSWSPAPSRGEAGAAWREPDGTPQSHHAVSISLTKAPGFDTLALTRSAESTLERIAPSLPDGVRLVTLYRQSDFISLAIGNLREALRDGSAMVAALLLLLLLNVRVALITLTAIPLSLAGTLITFSAFGMGVNAMTLGGLAVAVGLVVDDAIVDIENIHRRLREHAGRGGKPAQAEPVLVRAAAEVRASIFFATLLVILAFVPLLGLHGVEGRLFAPIAISTMVCLAVSFVVALTVVPAAASILLRPRATTDPRPPLLVRAIQAAFTVTLLRPALAQPLVVIAGALGLIGWAVSTFVQADRQFLPPFREPTVLLATATTPGTSLVQTTEYARIIQDQLIGVSGVQKAGYRVGRAERGDHVVPVSVMEFDITYEPSPNRSRRNIHADLRQAASLPGTYSVLSTPLADRIGHLLSGVTAPVVFKIHGPDLAELDRLGDRALALAAITPGLESARPEPQMPVPQWRIEVDRERARAHGLSARAVQEPVAALLGGEVVASIPDELRSLDVVVRLPEAWRADADQLLRLPVGTADGRPLALGRVADLHPAVGPGQIMREGTGRRLALTATPEPHRIAAAAEAWQTAIERDQPPPEGYFWTFEGSHAAEKAATKRLLLLSAVLLVAVSVLLWTYFRSTRLTLLVLLNLPLALVGGILLHQHLVGVSSIATLVGLIAVAGISARNTIMLLSHYLHLMRHERLPFGAELVVRGTRERLVPVLLTALSAALALLPILLSPDAAGKELLHPIAAVIVGGLISSTLLGLAVTPSLFLHTMRAPAERSVSSISPASS